MWLRFCGKLRGNFLSESTAIQLSQNKIFLFNFGKSVYGSNLEGLIPFLEQSINGTDISTSLILPIS